MTVQAMLTIRGVGSLHYFNTANFVHGVSGSGESTDSAAYLTARTGAKPGTFWMRWWVRGNCAGEVVNGAVQILRPAARNGSMVRSTGDAQTAHATANEHGLVESSLLGETLTNDPRIHVPRGPSYEVTPNAFGVRHRAAGEFCKRTADSIRLHPRRFDFLFHYVDPSRLHEQDRVRT